MKPELPKKSFDQQERELLEKEGKGKHVKRKPRAPGENLGEGEK